MKKSGGGDASPDPLDGMDPARVERAMAKMERHMDKIDENKQLFNAAGKTFTSRA